MMTTNIENGASEAMLFGLRNALFDEDDYNTLSQCESVEDALTFLSASDYGFFLEGDCKGTERQGLQELQQKIVREFKYFRSGATSRLARFLDFVSESYQLDNVLRIIAGKRTKSTFDDLTRCNRLGDIPVMAALTTAADISEMLDILSETSSLQRYFTQEKAIDFDRMPIEFIRALVQKNWFEEFDRFCQSLGGETAEVMHSILSFEADREVLTLTLNTMGSQLGSEMSEEMRRALYPNIGSLAPIYTALAGARSLHDVVDCLHGFPEYEELLSALAGQSSAPKNKAVSGSFEGVMRRKAVSVYRDAFHQQFQFGLYYAYIKLKAIEIENIHWMIECINQGMRSHIGDFLIV